MDLFSTPFSFFQFPFLPFLCSPRGSPRGSPSLSLLISLPSHIFPSSHASFFLSLSVLSSLLLFFSPTLLSYSPFSPLSSSTLSLSPPLLLSSLFSFLPGHQVQETSIGETISRISLSGAPRRIKVNGACDKLFAFQVLKTLAKYLMLESCFFLKQSRDSSKYLIYRETAIVGIASFQILL